MLKHLLLRNRLADQSQILCGASLGRGNEFLFAASGSHDQDGRHAHICFVFVLFLLWFNVPVNNFSVMLRRSHLFLGITSTFLGSKCLLLKETNTPTRPRIEPGSPDPESDALTIRPVRPPRPYMVKTLQKSSSPEPAGRFPRNLVCSIGDSSSS